MLAATGRRMGLRDGGVITAGWKRHIPRTMYVWICPTALITEGGLAGENSVSDPWWTGRSETIHVYAVPVYHDGEVTAVLFWHR